MIRRLGPDEVGVLAALRLAALADAPTAYASTLEREEAYDDERWRFLLRADGHPTFVWDDEQGPRGMVVAVHDEGAPDFVDLFAMWVHPAARGTGAADALVARVLAWGRECGARNVRLQVTAGNHRAERVYARHGFVRTGATLVRERDGLVEFEMRADL